MRDSQPRTIFLKDYQPPAFLIDHTDLVFELYEEQTLVHGRLRLRRNPAHSDADAPLELHGQQLELLDLQLDGAELPPERYVVGPQGLKIGELPDAFELYCKTRILPQDNSSLEGLYKSRTLFCTQCEAEGFRKITYYLDRPDVMSVFDVRIEAEAARYPVLLSNGNLVGHGELDNGRRWVQWQDPFPKPAYLFALVAGDLAHIHDTFETSTGRLVDLYIYVEAKDLDKCGHAMRSLQNAMRWDEEVYGREYDLDIFNIVAVDDFNMGAMENKSLNIFNTSCVLANPDTTTDRSFQTVEAVVAHEYFHNWSGNRVTCRDWFQLSLKEGFTVFRDSQFSSDMNSPTVKRIQDASILRTAQFAEDAGPMAHPIRPDSFIEISNFYTVTVYEKGAEVVRMIHTLLGAERFRAGTDLYFQRHDGQAVTCDDFIQAMEDASGVDLQQFRRWYSQAGTPQLKVTGSYDEQAHTYTLVVEQSCPDTPGQGNKKPLVIPRAMGLIGDTGTLRLQLQGQEVDAHSKDNTSMVLLVDQAHQSFTFSDIDQAPIPSLLRNFSAPVKLAFDHSRNDLATLMRCDSDGFSRWDASQDLAAQVIQEVQQRDVEPDPLLSSAYGALFEDEGLDSALMAEMLLLPSHAYLAELANEIQPLAIHAARERVRAQVSVALGDILLQRYHLLTSAAPYAASAEQIAARALRNTCLAYLAAQGQRRGVDLALRQFVDANNMTDRLAALRVVVMEGSHAQREDVLERFYRAWKHEPLVVNQWFQVQAACSAPGTLARVQTLLQHEAFELKNPNKIRSLIGVFGNANPVNFHDPEGRAYEFYAGIIGQLNARNPQIAARLLTPLTKWRRYGEQGLLMKAQLEALASLPELSRDVYEVLHKCLDTPAAN